MNIHNLCTYVLKNVLKFKHGPNSLCKGASTASWGGGGGCYCEADRIWFGSDKCMYLNFTTKNTEIEKLALCHSESI